MENDLLKQHKEIYLNAIKEIIKNNTEMLVNDDLYPLFSAPPLEIMDTLKQKFLTLAKNYNLILDNNKVEERLQIYRKQMLQEIDIIGKFRCQELESKLNKLESNDDSTFKLLKKDLNELDKKIRKKCKEKMIDTGKEVIINEISNLFTNDEIPEKISTEIIKFITVLYPKQVLEMIDMKILVKDTILINSVKEQTERFIFTTENSHLFD